MITVSVARARLPKSARGPLNGILISVGAASVTVTGLCPLKKKCWNAGQKFEARGLGRVRHNLCGTRGGARRHSQLRGLLVGLGNTDLGQQPVRLDFSCSVSLRRAAALGRFSCFAQAIRAPYRAIS